MIPNDHRIVSHQDMPPLPEELWNEIIQHIGPINRPMNKQIALVCKYLMQIWRAGVKAIHITLNRQNKFSLVRDYPFDAYPKLRQARISEVEFLHPRANSRRAPLPNLNPKDLNIQLEFTTGNSMREAANILSKCPELAKLVNFLGVAYIDHAPNAIAKSLPKKTGSGDPEWNARVRKEFDPNKPGSGDPEWNARVRKEFAPEECRPSAPYDMGMRGQNIIQNADKPTIDDVVAVTSQLPDLASLAIEDFPMEAGITDAELIQLLNLKMLRHLRLNLRSDNLTQIGLDALSKSELVSLDLTKLATSKPSEVLGALSQMPRLEKLILEEFRPISEYSAISKGWNNLKHLRIKNCCLTKNFFATFKDQLNELESLDLWYELEDPEIQHLVDFGALPKLKYITLKSWSTMRERDKLPELLAQLPCIEEVTLCEYPNLWLNEDDKSATNANQQAVRIKYRDCY